MPDYARLRELVSHRVSIEYDTGARIVGYVAQVRPTTGPVQFLVLSRAELRDASGAVLETHDSLSVCPNIPTAYRLEEGPAGRERNGTRVTFMPSTNTFKNVIEFNFDTLEHRFREHQCHHRFRDHTHRSDGGHVGPLRLRLRRTARF